MASYHLTVKNHSRSKNANAVALASYRSGERLWDERQMLHKNCRKNDKSEVLHSELFNSYRMNREQLWNAAEAAENRKNSVVAREIEIALPVDISDVQKVSLARDFCKELVGRYRCAIDLAVHAPDADGDQRNYHAHILMTTREVSVGGMGVKWRQLNQPNGAGRIEMAELRKKFELLQNRYLENAGVQERVSCGRAADMDIPRKYVALPFKKYQVMRREGRVEEYKEVSGYEEFVRWKSRKELEIEDLAGELELSREREELERKMDSDIYYYDPVSAQIDVMAQEYEERKELEQRSEDYGLDGNEPRAGIGAFERSESIGGSEEGFGANELGREFGYRELSETERKEGEFGSSRAQVGGTDSDRSEERDRSLEIQDRELPGWLQGHFDGLREGFREQCENIDRSVECISGAVEHSLRQSQEEFKQLCRRRDEQIQQREERVNKLRRENESGIERARRRTEQSYQRTHDVAGVYSGAPRSEQCRRARRAIRRGGYAHAVKQLSCGIRAACRRFGEIAKEAFSLLRGQSVGGVKRRLGLLLSPFAEKELPGEVRLPAQRTLEIERPVGCKLDNPDWEIKLKYDKPCPDLENIPIIDEESRMDNMDYLSVRQDRGISVMDRLAVVNLINVLKKCESGRQILSDAVDPDYEFGLPAEKFWEEVSGKDREVALRGLDCLKQGVKELVIEKCPEIIEEREEKKKFSFRRDRDDGPERGRSIKW